MSTFYAPSERLSLQQMLDEKASLENLSDMKALLASLSYIVFILNTKRQIVFANDLLIEKLNLQKDIDLLGLRPGEAMHCVNSKKGPGGCGTSEFCRHCSNVNVILDVLESDLPSTREGKMIVKNGEYEQQLDLELTATPLKFGGHDYIVFSALDITDRRRKELLERTFFHDIINLAGTLDGIMELMEEMEEKDRGEFFKRARRISNSLIEEIMAQRELVKAENNELKVKAEAYVLNELLQESVASIRYHSVARNKSIEFIPLDDDYGIITDKVLLNRVIVNLLKNALEAIPSGQIVKIAAKKTKNGFVIEVHNDSFIPMDVQQQLFQRSFSTKGTGRGIGTYSIKLLGERYLKGQVEFHSNQKSGTTFYLKLPQKVND